MSAADFPDASQFTVEEIRAIVEEAKAAGIHGTLAHAEGTSGIKNALRAGITSIEHGDLIDDEGIDLMLERDVPLIPTFNINFSLMDEARIARGEVPPWAVEKMRYLFDRQQLNFRHAVERGVRVVMGTDSFSGLYPPAELAYMSEFGLGPFRAIQAATSEAAKLLGLADQVGSLEAEPELWRDPARIVFVMQGGRIVADRRGA
jgi:imidazolonepropionase-like amidohydrolase